MNVTCCRLGSDPDFDSVEFPEIPEDVDDLSPQALRKLLRSIKKAALPSQCGIGIRCRLLDGVEFAVAVVGSDFRIRDLNAAFIELFGPEAAWGHSITHISRDADFQERLLPALEQGLTGLTFEMEISEDTWAGPRWFQLFGRPIAAYKDDQPAVVLTIQEVTLQKQSDRRHRVTARVLRQLNQSGNQERLIRDILREIKDGFDMDAAGLRLRKGEGYPYHEVNGLSEAFVQAESFLCRRDARGEIQRDANGSARLACMCGTVISGGADPREDCFTERGSFWSPDLCALVEEIQGTPLAEGTRQQCHLEGFQSAALIPLRTGAETIGLLQLADPRPNRLTEADIHFLEDLGNSIGVALARLRDEERLREKEADLRRAQAVAHIGSWQFDLENRIVQTSPEARRIYGLAEAELTIPRVQEIPLPQFRPLLNGALEALVRDGTPYDLTFQIRRPEDGRIVDIHSVAEYDAERNVVVGVIQDITEKRRAEQALRESESRYRALAETLPIGLLETDAEGAICYANPAFFRMLDYPSDRVIGRRPWEFAEKSERFRQRFFAYLGDQPAPKPAFLRAVHTSGELRDVRLDWDYRRDETGNAIGFISVVTDITDRQRLEMQLRQAQKLEGIGQLAGGVAHDFNNMLSPIIGYAEMLNEDLKPTDPRVADVSEILRAAVRSRNLVQKLLAFARKQTLEMKPIRLNRIIKEMEPMLHRTIREDIQISSDLAAAPDGIRGDVGQIEQVILNLVVNARDAMPDGGHITIETRQVFLDESYAENHPSAEPGAYVLLSVSDTGTGMRAETRARVFEPFFTTKPTGQGTGMGLATVYGIVKQHKGNIWVYSEPERGTTFKLFFPSTEAGEESRGTVETAALRGEGETVLLVEDEPSVRQLVRQVLDRRGYAVLEMESPKACLEFLEGYNAPIDLLLTDVVMPGMNGRELHRRIAETRPGLRALYMSGYTENVIVHHGVLDPGVALLHKPFSVKELSRKVREVLDGGDHPGLR